MPRLAPLLALALAPLLLSAAACASVEDDDELPRAEDLPPQWQPLVDHADWQADVADDDPLPDHRPADVRCDGGWHRETDGIEIETAACNYLSLQQPLPFALREGDPLRLRLWWQSLASVEPAQGHLAVLIGEELVWEEHVPIPGPADVRSIEIESPIDAEPGEPITFHLHNHGYNTWHFHELSALLPPND